MEHRKKKVSRSEKLGGRKASKNQKIRKDNKVRRTKKETGDG